MDIAAVSLVLAAIFAGGLISTRAGVISAPIFFVVIGLILGEGLKLVQLEPDPHFTRSLPSRRLGNVKSSKVHQVDLETAFQQARTSRPTSRPECVLVLLTR
jgi:hypothetical protein